MAEFENDELNRQLCAVAADEMFECWSAETQEQVLAEWNDWQKPGHCYIKCCKVFTRSNDLKRHIRRVHTGERPLNCLECDKKFATEDKLRRRMKTYEEKSEECPRCHKKIGRNVC